MAEAIVDDVHPSRKFYVYIIWRPDGRPCYVGKGKGDRWKAHFSRTHNRHLRNIVAKYGDLLRVERIFIESESRAYELEAFLIGQIGRHPNGPLVNQSDGGKGGSAGRKMTPDEVRRRTQILIDRGVMDKLKASNFTRGPVSKETRAKMSAAQMARIAVRSKNGIQHGYKPTPETLEKRSKSLRLAWKEGRHAGLKNKTWTEEDRRRQSELSKRRWNRDPGYKHSEETRLKISESQKGRRKSRESVEARRQGLRRRLDTDPTVRIKQSHRMRRWWAERKAALNTTFNLFEECNGPADARD